MNFNLLNFYKTFPANRYYLYINQLRNISTRRGDTSQEELVKNYLDHINSGNTPKWNTLKEDVLKTGSQINEINFDASIIGFCFHKKDLSNAKLFFNHLIKSNTKPNNATIAKLLKLYHVCYEGTKLPKDAENEIKKLCESFQKKYGLLDSISSESSIAALSLTKDWKKCLDHLENIHLTGSPTANSYSFIITAAFRNNEPKLAWKLLNEMLVHNRKPMLCVYKEFLTNTNYNIEEILEFLSNNDIKPPKAALIYFLNNSKKCNLNGNEAYIKKSGYCSVCRERLSLLPLSNTEFEHLKTNFYEKVMIGKNLYTKTTPEELEKFHKFVETIKPSDIVIDGLNVAYSAGANQSPIKFSIMIAKVVEYFVNRSKNVILLGRVHMLNWKNVHMKYVLANCSVFLTENLSQDDPFLLYATMYNGSNTGFVSRDLMRSHIFKLSDPYLKALFRRWQNSNQHQLVYVDSNGKVIIRNPLPFMPSAQRHQNSNGTYWHIPFETDTPQDNMPVIVPETWLCLNNVSSVPK